MSSDVAPDVSALAINVTIPEPLRWTDTRRSEQFTLTTLNVRLLPDGHLAAKAYGRPAGGGRGTYVSFPYPTGPNWRPSSPTPPAALQALTAADHLVKIEIRAVA
jgi:hypothetical protein